ncbi:50S ribosomal protein L21 [Striga asiatica]|uniref:50S ribosomal protein L21 n=1 Tax=Striga asiatica TaxID=4170 RepID=A0A5A7Q428_STRAF|nr:50S ribosomal protein L21 [Striga asiatica]
MSERLKESVLKTEVLIRIPGNLTLLLLMRSVCFQRENGSGNRSDHPQAGEDVNGSPLIRRYMGLRGRFLVRILRPTKICCQVPIKVDDSAWQEWTENDDGDPMCFDEAISDDEESGDPGREGLAKEAVALRLSNSLFSSETAVATGREGTEQHPRVRMKLREVRGRTDSKKRKIGGKMES